jgi:hypothetical protein
VLGGQRQRQHRDEGDDQRYPGSVAVAKPVDECPASRSAEDHTDAPYRRDQSGGAERDAELSFQEGIDHLVGPGNDEEDDETQSRECDDGLVFEGAESAPIEFALDRPRSFA